MNRVGTPCLGLLSLVASLLVVGCSGKADPSPDPSGSTGSPSSSGSTGSSSSSSDECTWDQTEKCTLPNGNSGLKACEVGKDGYVWGPCAATSQSSGSGSQGGGPTGSSSTPLVLAFEREPVQFTQALGEFDVVGSGASFATDWVGTATPWLAVDLDGNGSIDDGRELFGSMTVLPDGTRAPNGFAALAALDDDHDGRITERDAIFDRLLVWRDGDQDRRSSPDELSSARDAGLVSIDLGYRIVPRCHAGDCEVERATFTFRDARGVTHTGDAVDVHFAAR
jgi:hypothetical protein